MPNHRRLTNGLQSALMFIGMLALLAALAMLLGGTQLIPALMLGGIILLAGATRISPRWILALYGARRLERQDNPDLFDLRDRLSARADLEQAPSLYYIATPILNAFSVGHRSDAAIGLSDGLLRSLPRRELTGVLAHEIAHIQHNDVWVMTLADVLGQITRILSFLGQILLLINLPLLLLSRVHIAWSAILLLIAAPWLSMLLQLGLSRSREFSADLGAVELTGDPEALASALVLLENRQPTSLMGGTRARSEPSLLRSHPVTEQRIVRLRELTHAPEDTLSDGKTDPFHPGWPPTAQSPRRRWRSGFWH